MRRSSIGPRGRGFTLIEPLVVITIIGLCWAVATRAGGEVIDVGGF